ncbi:[citrate (pro-3S)-lyase] ligase [Pelosinus propionicus]|uniref:[Citrate [pro-3S]-lyase] ligase n=1 Tax=Pelosinus propionicus DSM 13327 TaxID=1123291 RepID=A0A1I4JFR8_9FIRM|nr:[citrate (pro-3S)-lyase] ligase [Pelosinus propionicus]SFL65402.1 [citrate (pro-3S)-lyase] ligase [Pelosinus propionicus DSM 13327]
MLWGTMEERVINLNNVRQVSAVREFLSRFSLTFTEQVDYTIALYKDDSIVATGSFAGEVLRNIAIDESLQGEGLTSAVVSNLMQEAGRRGIYHYFIFTKPDKAHLFSALGFKEVGRADPYAVLLEAGIGSIDSYCKEMAALTAHLPSGKRAGLVVNCNPFTLGHQAVIAKASKENAAVVVLVVSEEGSVFPFDIRLSLVKQGLADYDNVVVLPGGKYIVSAATFPGYFTKGNETVMAQTRLDATIFAKHIAPAMGITCRYVGDEPYCLVTKAYNQAMFDILPEHQIDVLEMPRISVHGNAVSASRVRELIRQEGWEAIRALVPDTTYQFLCSPAAIPIIEKIQSSISRH